MAPSCIIEMFSCACARDFSVVDIFARSRNEREHIGCVYYPPRAVGPYIVTS